MLPFELTPKQEKAKRTRLWKCYRWTLEMYNALGELQGWKCAGCGREAKTMPLNVDHEHPRFKAEKKVAIDYRGKKSKVWKVTAYLSDGRSFVGYGQTKTAAVEQAKDLVLPASIRGLLCAGRYAGCNRKLGRIDQIPWLENMLKYLKDPPAQRLRMQRAFSASPQGSAESVFQVEESQGHEHSWVD